MDGGQNADQYRILEEDSIDVIADSGDDLLNYAKWHYEGALGIPDWLHRFEHGGQYAFNNDGEIEYYDSLDDFIPWDGWTISELIEQGYLAYVELLPELPEIAFDDWDSIGTLVSDEFVISSDYVIFDKGVSLDDLELSVDGDYLSVRTAPNVGVDILLAKEGDLIGTGIERIVVDEGWFSMGDFLDFASGTTATVDDDVLWGTSSGDVINGSAGYDWILGRGGNDILFGGDDDDYIVGGFGDDILNGGGGNDFLEGGSGNDTYVFNPGSGSDFIYDVDLNAGNVDTVQFGSGITAEDTTVVLGEFDLKFTFAGIDDTLTISSATLGASGRVERFEFADGTVWDIDTIAAMTGYQPIQYFYGTSNNDSFSGSASSDAYLIRPNGGIDEISDAGGNDTLIFGSGITSEMVTLGLGSLLKMAMLFISRDLIPQMSMVPVSSRISSLPMVRN